MPPIKVILLACGSYSPPTNMHLRMFEIARDYLHRMGNYIVVGGLMSPVHDAYGKKDLIAATHRIAMLKLALQDNDWIKVSDWEATQESWSRTKVTIQHHQNLLNAASNNANYDIDTELLTWIPNNIKNGCIGPVQVKLLCGADLLESFGVPGLWADEDIDTIVGQHGLVVITREGSNPLKFIYESDILTRYMANIHIVTEWIANEISSTKIRRAFRRLESVKYLIPDDVIDYIYENGLYGTKNNSKYLTASTHVLNLLTPSPTDVVMESPSPPDNRCISICNNNLFLNNKNKQQLITLSTEKQANNLDTIDNNTKLRHPGQAVKILTDTSGEHMILRTNEVGSSATNSILKVSKSCSNFIDEKPANEFHKTIRSNSELKCDENMIKFIFTKHGIQVISDIETVV